LQSLGVGPATAGVAGNVVGYGVPLAGIGLGGKSLYDQFSESGSRSGLGRQGVRAGAAGAAVGAGAGALYGSALGPIGALAGGLLGGAAGVIHGATSSGKGKGQKERDAVRSYLKDNQLLDNDWKWNFEDGSYNFGIDNPERRYQVGWGRDDFVGHTGEDTTQLDAYLHHNFGNEIGALNPLTLSLFGRDRLGTDMTGYFVNAVSQPGADTRSRIRDVYGKAMGGTGLDKHSELYQSIWGQFNEGSIDANQRDASLAALDLLWGIDNPAGPADERAKAKANPNYGTMKDGAQGQSSPGTTTTKSTPAATPMPELELLEEPKKKKSAWDNYQPMWRF
jgi:hypothetical protein